MNIIPEIAAKEADIVAWRHAIHAHPELAYEEHQTADLVADRLNNWGLDVHRGLATTGVVGTLVNGDGPVVGLRADMDALPIHEANDFDYKSQLDGKMHACGHDGHTAMLLGAARYLAESREFEGTIRFIFQPAEEAARGARVMMDEGLYSRCSRLTLCSECTIGRGWRVGRVRDAAWSDDGFSRLFRYRGYGIRNPRGIAASWRRPRCGLSTGRLRLANDREPQR